MHVLATPAVVEQVLLEVVRDREELAARRVRRSVLAVRARDAARERSCNRPNICQKTRSELGGEGKPPHRLRPGGPPRG